MLTGEVLAACVQIPLSEKAVNKLNSQVHAQHHRYISELTFVAECRILKGGSSSSCGFYQTDFACDAGMHSRIESAVFILRISIFESHTCMCDLKAPLQMRAQLHVDVSL